MTRVGRPRPPRSRQLIAQAHFNFIGSFRKLIDHCPNGAIQEDGGVFAFSTGLPQSLFNGCIVVEPAQPAGLEAALEWIAGRHVPYRLWIADPFAPALAPVARAFGLERDVAPYPGMVLRPIPRSPGTVVGVTVAPVTTRAALAEHIEVRVRSGLTRELARRVFSPSFAADADVQLYTARLDGRPVGASVAIRTGEVSGIYAVGTLEVARRRGVGSAASWAAVEAARQWGCDTVILQASEMGLPVYRAMGFRTVVSYAVFRPAAAQLKRGPVN